MSPRTRWIFLAVVVLQLLFLLGLATYKEVTLRTGQEVVLQTVPVDPRDLFRGDYVVLRYKVSTLGGEPDYVDLNGLLGLGRLDVTKPGDTAYVVLTQRQGVWVASRATLQRPEEFEVFLTGRLTSVSLGAFPLSATVEYGIESYFVPEGQGRELETAARAGTLLARVRINRFGEAVIQELIVDGKPWRPK
jgi:uncharacterized membrane-anchored protein